MTSSLRFLSFSNYAKYKNFSSIIMTTTCRNFSVSRTPLAAQNSLVDIKEEHGLRKITLNDSKTRNALSFQMMTELVNGIRNSSNFDLRCIAIGANGPVFSAGHNLKELTAEWGVEQQTAIFSKCTELMLAIKECDVPVIAVVNGQLAAAAGCQLVAACDFAFATESSTFSTPGANFGVFCSTPGISVSRVVNPSVAAFMVLTGLPLTAQEANKFGLVARVVPDGRLDDTLEEVYHHIQNKSKSILTRGKKFFNHQIRLSYEEALRQGAAEMVDSLSTPDAQEGLESFKSKRKPIWTHK